VVLATTLEKVVVVLDDIRWEPLNTLVSTAWWKVFEF
jgi:hypothetical protein